MGLMGAIKRAVGEPSWRRVPWHILILAGAITSVGAIFIWSAQGREMALKHVTFAGIGLAAFTALALIDYRHLTVAAIPLYVLGLVALPQMFRLGYDRKLTIGLICASGALATLIPPSIIMIEIGRAHV